MDRRTVCANIGKKKVLKVTEKHGRQQPQQGGRGKSVKIL
nr:MAG TPA: hypothetical protein [Caudoviricetes sp.]